MEKTVTLLKSGYDRMEKICEEYAKGRKSNTISICAVIQRGYIYDAGRDRVIFNAVTLDDFKDKGFDVFKKDIEDMFLSVSDEFKSKEEVVKRYNSDAIKELQLIKSKWWYNLLVKNH